jgi:hypothetical protein
MYQVKTYNAIAQAGLDRFSDNYQINKTDEADAYLIVRSIFTINHSQVFKGHCQSWGRI